MKKIFFITHIFFISHMIFSAQKYNDQATRALFTAVQEANLQQVKKALENGADIYKTHLGMPLLFWALNNTRDSSAIIKTLIDAGTDMYVKDKQGTYAIKALNDVSGTGIIHLKALIDKGLNKNWQDDDGNTLAHHFRKAQYPDLLHFILEEGINTNIKNNDDETIFTISTFYPGHYPNSMPEQAKKVDDVLTKYQEKMALHKAAMTRSRLTEAEQKKFGHFPTGITKEIADYLVGPLTPGQKQELQRQIDKEKAGSPESLLAKEQKKVEMLTEELRKLLPELMFNKFMEKLEKV